MVKITNKLEQMKRRQDLTPEERKIHDAMIEKAMVPFEERGIVKRTKRGHLDMWATTVNPKKLEEAVKKAIAKKEGPTGTVIINGSTVILSVGIFILNVFSEADQKSQDSLDEYLKELDS